jgi:peroxiredoxin
VDLKAIVLACAIAATGCTGARPTGAVPDATLDGSDGSPHALGAAAHAAPATVIFFFSAGCPVQRAHDTRLRELYARFAPRGVVFFGVDSETGASPARATAEARARSYPFALLADGGGKVADALGAEYATYAVIVDRTGTVRYRGAIDTDRTHLTADTRPWLADALERVLAGAAPDPARTEALGCVLRR